MLHILFQCRMLYSVTVETFLMALLMNDLTYCQPNSTSTLCLASQYVCNKNIVMDD